MSKNTYDGLIDWLGTKNEVIVKELKHKVKDVESAKTNRLPETAAWYLKKKKKWKNPESTWKNEENLLKEQNYVK